MCFPFVLTNNQSFAPKRDTSGDAEMRNVALTFFFSQKIITQLLCGNLLLLML